MKVIGAGWLVCVGSGVGRHKICSEAGRTDSWKKFNNNRTDLHLRSVGDILTCMVIRPADCPPMVMSKNTSGFSAILTAGGDLRGTVEERVSKPDVFLWDQTVVRNVFERDDKSAGKAGIEEQKTGRGSVGILLAQRDLSSSRQRQENAE